VESTDEMILEGNTGFLKNHEKTILSQANVKLSIIHLIYNLFYPSAIYHF